MPWRSRLWMTCWLAPDPSMERPSLDMMRLAQAAVARDGLAPELQISFGQFTPRPCGLLVPPSPSQRFALGPSLSHFVGEGPQSPFPVQREREGPIAARRWEGEGAHINSTQPVHAGLGVELLDQRIPPRYRRLQAAPESLIPPPVEIRERHALLLDPGVVPEIEDPLAVDMPELEHVIVPDLLEMGAEDLACLHLAEPAGETRGCRFFTLAAVHRGTVGRDRRDRVAAAETEPLCRLDRRQHVRNAGETEAVEALHQRRIDTAAVREIALTRIAVEQQIERIRAAVRDTDHDVRVQDIVNERDVLVADALDVVLAIAVHEHGRTFHGLHGDDLRAELRLQIIAGAQRPRRARCRHEGCQLQRAVTSLHVLEHRAQGRPGAD